MKAEPCDTMAMPSTTMNSTRSACRRSRIRRKSLGTRRPPQPLDERQRLAMAPPALGRGELQALLHERDVGAEVVLAPLVRGHADTLALDPLAGKDAWPSPRGAVPSAVCTTDGKGRSGSDAAEANELPARKAGDPDGLRLVGVAHDDELRVGAEAPKGTRRVRAPEDRQGGQEHHLLPDPVAPPEISDRC